MEVDAMFIEWFERKLTEINIGDEPVRFHGFGGTFTEDEIDHFEEEGLFGHFWAKNRIVYPVPARHGGYIIEVCGSWQLDVESRKDLPAPAHGYHHVLFEENATCHLY